MTSYYIQPLIQLMTATSYKLEQWANTWGISFNPSKYEYLKIIYINFTPSQRNTVYKIILSKEVPHAK